MDLRGARALVTGASSGIGLATAGALAAAGASLALSGRRTDALAALADTLAAPGRSRPALLPADLSQPSAAADLARRAVEALGGIDVLVNAAGEFETGWQWEAGDGAEARRLFETNYWSPLALVRALVPDMRARGAGAVVNMTSLSTLTPLPRIGPYAQAKAALASATESLRLETAGAGVQVVLVFLGAVDTPMHAKALRAFGAGLRRMPVGRPEDVARRIVRALVRGRSYVVHPRAIGIVRQLPTVSRWLSERVVMPLVLRPAPGGSA